MNTMVRVSLKMRMKPEIFTDTIENLSEQQRQWVKDTGFQSLLSFKIREYPVVLAGCLVSSFNHSSCTMKVKEDFVIIHERDVEHALGFPMGTNIIQISNNYNVKEAWRSQFSSSHYNGHVKFFYLDRVIGNKESSEIPIPVIVRFNGCELSE
ncbi:hypothetical protein POM88_000908 [Heracleum sosnowskyi]|uniref:Uncharacterized protein n=1 Tax=Heracleum sosnowskyi TaxID=360622 RepID=A0AAD8JCG9_9APIA|nr:hypothetical protein POM88_000908 [Heracleum sosnowskyi]